MRDSKFYKKVHTITSKTKSYLYDVFASEIDNIIEVGKSAYEDNLLGVVIDKDSLSNPEFFYSEFVNRLEDFEYVSYNKNEVVLKLPNNDSFNYNDGLEIIKYIVEGVAGKYFELKETDLNLILKMPDVDNKVKRRLRDLPGVYSDNTPLDRRFRLVPSYGTLLKTAQAVLDKKLVLFPFSNFPSVDLFEPMKDYVDNNINNWISKSIKLATNHV